MSKSRSLKGEIVDFDLLKIKQQISASPAPVEVSSRKQHIDDKLHRRIKKAKDDIYLAKQKADSIDEKSNVEEPKPKRIKKVKTS